MPPREPRYYDSEKVRLNETDVPAPASARGMTSKRNVKDPTGGARAARHEIRNAIAPAVALLEVVAESLGEMAIDGTERQKEKIVEVSGDIQAVMAACQRVLVILDRHVQAAEAIGKVCAESVNHLHEVDLSSLVVAQVSPWARTHSKDAVFSMEISEGIKVLGDLTQLEEVVANLVKNALEIVQSTGQFPRIRVALNEVEGGFARLIIQDNGPGISSQDEAKLFQKGYTRKGGQGMGLWLSRQFIRHMGGRIALVNNSQREELPLLEREEGGASAVVELPVFKVEKA